MTHGSNWTPPADPDPRTIDREAHDDRRAGRYADALAKRLWYHRHALAIDRHLHGVRLSFALSAWHKLARDYAPAMEALRSERDAAERRTLDHPNDRGSFGDFVAFNRILNERDRTVVVFAEIHGRDASAAEGLYRLAEPALLAAERDDLCRPYLDPERRLEFAAKAYEAQARHETEFARQKSGPSPPPLARRFYLRDVGTLLALLARAGRRGEAEELVPRVREVVQGDDVESVIGQALEGRFPPDALHF